MSWRGWPAPTRSARSPVSEPARRVLLEGLRGAARTVRRRRSALESIAGPGQDRHGADARRIVDGPGRRARAGRQADARHRRRRARRGGTGCRGDCGGGARLCRAAGCRSAEAWLRQPSARRCASWCRRVAAGRVSRSSSTCSISRNTSRASSRLKANRGTRCRSAGAGDHGSNVCAGQSAATSTRGLRPVRHHALPGPSRVDGRQPPRR